MVSGGGNMEIIVTVIGLHLVGIRMVTKIKIVIVMLLI